MIERERLHGHQFQSQDQILACMQVVIMPDIDNIGFFTINDESRYGRGRPSDC